MCCLIRRLWLAAVLSCLPLLPASAQVPLVSTGAVWRYFDLGSEPVDWKNPLFNDAGWSNGPAQLGFSSNPAENDEATFLARTNSAGATNITFYFRHAFNVPDPSMITNLLVRLRRDDGAIVYLNGEEIFRSNLPPGPVGYDTLASAAASDDGAGLYAGPAMISLLVPGANVLGVEVHQSAITSSDISFDLEFTGNVTFQAPAVRLVSPGDGEFVGGSQFTMTAIASDSDGVIASVEFFQGATLLGVSSSPVSVVSTNATFALTWSNVPPGTHTLRALAVDSTGLSATSAPVVMHVVSAIVPRGAVWKYLDNDTDLTGSGWQMAGFDDSGWSNGVAQLGYGDGDEATLINGGPTSSRFITTYFRHAFMVADPGAFSNLVLRVLRDDGVVAYLNDVEVFRHNMPAGPVTHSTLAEAAIDDPWFHAAPVNPTLLVSGTNVLAVEIHQAGPTSSDVSFDLELLPNISPTPPAVAMTAPVNNASFLGPLQVSLTAATWDLNDAVTSAAFFDDATLLGSAGVNTEGDATLIVTLNPGPHVLRAVATDAAGLSSTSAPVTVMVIPAPIVTTLVSTGAVWRYFDVNTNLGTAWRAAGYDDSSWSNGPGILGFGQLGPASVLPATVINGGPAGNRTITAYFRRTFTATNIAAITNLAFNVVRDDGVVLYLNNAELFRMNMGPGNITYVSRATNNVNGTNELFYAPTNVVVTPGLLVEGENLLAVELHQDNPMTSDGAFDLRLVAISTPMPPPPSPEIAHNGPDITITWPGSGFVLQRADVPEGPYNDLPVATSPYLVPQTAPSGFFRLKRAP